MIYDTWSRDLHDTMIPGSRDPGTPDPETWIPNDPRLRGSLIPPIWGTKRPLIRALKRAPNSVPLLDPVIRRMPIPTGTVPKGGVHLLPIQGSRMGPLLVPLHP